MATAINNNPGNQKEEHFLPAQSWAQFAIRMSGLVDQAKHVIDGGGLQDPAIAAYLAQSRSTANPLSAALEAK